MKNLLEPAFKQQEADGSIAVGFLISDELSFRDCDCRRFCLPNRPKGASRPAPRATEKGEGGSPGRRLAQSGLRHAGDASGPLTSRPAEFRPALSAGGMHPLAFLENKVGLGGKHQRGAHTGGVEPATKHHSAHPIRLVLSVARRCVLPALWLASMRYLNNRAQRKAAAKWRADALQTLETATDAELRLLLKELPPWVVTGASHKASGRSPPAQPARVGPRRGSTSALPPACPPRLQIQYPTKPPLGPSRLLCFPAPCPRAQASGIAPAGSTPCCASSGHISTPPYRTS